VGHILRKVLTAIWDTFVCLYAAAFILPILELKLLILGTVYTPIFNMYILLAFSEVCKSIHYMALLNAQEVMTSIMNFHCSISG
jgi:hypothetical protein